MSKRLRELAGGLALLIVSTLARPAHSAGSDVAETPSTLMGVLSQRGWHDLQQERWNAYAQFTYISSFKLPFPARYTNLHGTTQSLQPTAEHSYTGTLTVFLGVALWSGAELYWVPELIAERPLSHLAGLGSAIQNFELQKTGSMWPTPYSSRLFVRQTFALSDATQARDSGPMQLAGALAVRRLVITLGNFSILDFFDRNNFASDLRQQYFNMAFLTHAAYDFAADARGYAWGVVVEYFHDAWAIRIGRITPPLHPNQLALDFRIWEFYGDQIEFEHHHALWRQPGAVRLLAFRNREMMGRFDEAVAAYQANPAHNATTCTGFNYGSNNASGPDLCWVRRPHIKWGVGVGIEQRLNADVGLFARAMWADGQTEVYSYTATDRSFSFGVVGQGTAWNRPLDRVGVAYEQGFVSDAHAAYLNAGGIDGFIGDGQIRLASEHVLEAFYSINVLGPTWLSIDYQHIAHPAYNADRGPVTILGVRLHTEG